MKPHTMNKAQQKAFFALYQRVMRWNELDYTPKIDTKAYRAFRRKAYYSYTMGCFMIQDVYGMTLGMESDGYIHS